MDKKIFAATLLLTAAIGAQGAQALWLRDVQISPDGSHIAFCYKGDIYSVPSKGGRATRLTTVDSYESNPIWSPDGSRIAFASDRHGNFDVFVMDAAGGPAKRLTSNSAGEIPEGFSPDGKEVYYSAAIQAPASSVMFPTGRMTQLYAVGVDGGASRQVLPTPAKNLEFAPDGSFMLYTDLKGFEDEWRKHHTSSVSRDIWRYDFATGKHTNITNRPGEDRDANYDAAQGAVYLLSERDGDTFNVWTFPLAAPDKAERLTDFKTHPVRFLSRADNGLMAFTYDGEIYTMAQGGKPAKITVDVVADEAPATVKCPVRAASGVVSPDGKSVAFISRGDVFVTSVEYPTTAQITHTPAAERHLSWGSDSRILYYTSERSGRKNIYKATISRADDPDFANVASIKEEAVFTPSAGEEFSHPMVSPDGKKLAYVKNRNHLMVKDLKSGAVKELTKGETYPSKDDGMGAVWSPDSRWMAIEYVPEMRDPYSNIGLVNVETGEVTNITPSGYFAANPRFVLDGNAILYATDQYGMRAHASWGSQEDVMIVFLNREARDRFNLSEEDYALLKEKEKAAKSKADAPEKSSDKADKKSAKGKKDAKDKKSEDKKADKAVKPIVVELANIDTRIKRLTPYSSDLSDAIVTADGETLYYLSAFDDGYDLWKMSLRKRQPKLVSKLGAKSHVSFVTDKDGKTVFIVGDKIQKLDTKSDKLTAVTAKATQTIDPVAEREAMFDYMAVEEGERFYNTGMHGIDWPAMTESYRRFLPHINNNYDFAEMLSEILGELNVSHTGGRYRAGRSANGDVTASLGLLYDLDYKGDGLKVDEVVVNGPFDKAASKMAKGAVVTSVNNVAVKADTDMATLLADLAGKKTLVEFTTPDGAKVSEVVIPVTNDRMNSLLYDRWVSARAADVDRWSNGRLGYVHIPSMADESFRSMYADLLGKYANREGVVIDIRWNGGGRMHEDIEVLFTGKKYLTQEIRGKDVCDMPSRRWNKPSVMLVAEPCYSNAHGTPWVYQHQGIGKVVGAPVPGTMTSVNWVTMQDPSLVFGIPVIGYRTAEGNYLENTQLEPDVKVYNSPEDIKAGYDRQLHTAVETLLKQIDNKK